jgi:hypothetical protein
MQSEGNDEGRRLIGSIHVDPPEPFTPHNNTNFVLGGIKHITKCFFPYCNKIVNNSEFKSRNCILRSDGSLDRPRESQNTEVVLPG